MPIPAVFPVIMLLATCPDVEVRRQRLQQATISHLGIAWSQTVTVAPPQTEGIFVEALLSAEPAGSLIAYRGFGLTRRPRQVGLDLDSDVRSVAPAPRASFRSRGFAVLPGKKV